MSDIVQFPEQPNATRQACEWVARLDCGDIDDDEKAEFRRWINESSTHRDEVIRIASLMDHLAEINRLLDSGAAPRITAPARRFPTRWIGIAAAASIALAIPTALFVQDLRYMRGLHAE